MKLLALKWSPRNGLTVSPHPDFVFALAFSEEIRPGAFTFPAVRMIADVDSFNVIATENNWPRQRVEGWREEVRRALTELEAADFPGDWSLDQKVQTSLMLVDLLDHSDETIESALERLRTAGLS